MRAALLADLVEWALSRDPGSDVGVRVEMTNLGRVVCTYSMGWELNEAGGLVLTVAMLRDASHAGVGRGGPGGRGTCPQAHAHMAVVSAQINSGDSLK